MLDRTYLCTHGTKKETNTGRHTCFNEGEEPGEVQQGTDICCSTITGPERRRCRRLRKGRGNRQRADPIHCHSRRLYSLVYSLQMR